MRTAPKTSEKASGKKGRTEPPNRKAKSAKKAETSCKTPPEAVGRSASAKRLPSAKVKADLALPRSDQAVTAAEATKLLAKAKRIVVLSHVDPDVDTMGCALAMYLALKKLGKTCLVYNQDECPRTMRFLRGSADLITKLPPRGMFDVAVACDANGAKRFGDILTDPKTNARFRTILRVDHHLHGEPFADFSLVDATRSATGELIFDILRQPPFHMDRDLAFNLYATIVSDTGSFRYGNTNRRCFEVAGELLAYDVDPWEVSSALYESRPLVQLKIIAEVLRTLEVSPCGRYASVYASLEMLRSLNLQAEGREAEVYLDGIINFPRSIDGVEVAVFLKERENGWRVSLRSKGQVDVSAICRGFDGGGHRNAAGCFLAENFHKAKRLLTQSIEEELAKQLG